MKPRTTIDRLLITTGTLVLICAGGLSAPGCAVSPPTHTERAHLHTHAQCETDFECEMQQHNFAVSSRPTKWKLWTSIGLGVLITGYLYAQQQDNGNGTLKDSIDVHTPKVDCTATTGCAR